MENTPVVGKDALPKIIEQMPENSNTQPGFSPAREESGLATPNGPAKISQFPHQIPNIHDPACTGHIDYYIANFMQVLSTEDDHHDSLVKFHPPKFQFELNYPELLFFLALTGQPSITEALIFPTADFTPETQEYTVTYASTGNPAYIGALTATQKFHGTGTLYWNRETQNLNDVIMYQGNFREGLFDGDEVVFYSEHKRWRAVANFHNGAANRYCVIRDPNSIILFQGEFKHSKLYHECTFNYEATGRLKYKGNFQGGNLIEETDLMNPDGDVMARLYFLGGVPEGEGTIFYTRRTHGKLSKRGWFLNTPTDVKESYVPLVNCHWTGGMPHGQGISINYNNGQPWYHGEMKSGLKTGDGLIYFHKKSTPVVCGLGSCFGGNNKPKMFRYVGKFADGKKNG
jgi:antitoxin component YwqK of YwqJK toxin-antitoxin module